MGLPGSTYSLGRELIIASDSLPCENNCTLMCIYERLSDNIILWGTIAYESNLYRLV